MDCAQTSLNHQEILGIAFTNFTNAWKHVDLDDNCLKSQAIFGSVLSNCKISQMWTEDCPNFQKLQGLRS